MRWYFSLVWAAQFQGREVYREAIKLRFKVASKGCLDLISAGRMKPCMKDNDRIGCMETTYPPNMNNYNLNQIARFSKFLKQNGLFRLH